MDGAVGSGIAEWLPLAKLYVFTFIGAFTLYLLNKLQNRNPFSLFAAINIDVSSRAPSIIVLLDMVLSSMIGAAVVVPLTSPTTVPQAILVGLGMTGILSAHAPPQPSAIPATQSVELQRILAGVNIDDSHGRKRRAPVSAGKPHA